MDVLDATTFGNVKLLSEAMDQCLASSSTGKSMTINVFTKPERNGSPLVHIAAKEGHVDCLAFFVENLPSKEESLYAEDLYGRIAAGWAASCGQVDAFDFIWRHCDLENKTNLFRRQCVIPQCTVDYVLKLFIVKDPLCSSSSSYVSSFTP